MKTLPGLHELISGDLNLAGQIRPVEVEDVLGREPVEVDIDAIAGYLAGESVLVTGAGGSIGAELCRQIARVGPARLVLVDHAEPALFEIERELVDERGFPATLPVLADVKNRRKMRQVFETLPPGGRLPRRRVQARAADRVEPDRGGAEQHARDAHAGRGRGRVRRRAASSSSPPTRP